MLAFAEAISRLRSALERAEERFVRVLEEIQAAAFVVDPGSGQVRYANPRLAQMFGTGNEAPSARVPAWCLQRGDVAHAGHDGRAVDAAPGSDFRIEERRDPVTGRWYLVQAGAIPWTGRRGAGLRVLADSSSTCACPE